MSSQWNPKILHERYFGLPTLLPLSSHFLLHMLPQVAQTLQVGCLPLSSLGGRGHGESYYKPGSVALLSKALGRVRPPVSKPPGCEGGLCLQLSALTLHEALAPTLSDY